ncbi:MAG: DUF1054 family protein [Thermaerobacter sp.]|nr:DUF1054 family protein [Thermaerobacter sp.]
MPQFTGFLPSDFDVFGIPEFHARMSAIRMRVRPKLAMLGEDLAPRLTVLLGHPIHPHTASHARRRVNPPDDTWVAFSRSGRGYKRYAHFELGLAQDTVFVRFVVKPEGDDDKPTLLQYLQREGPRVFDLNQANRTYWYRDDHGRDPVAVKTIDPPAMANLLDQVRLKSRGFTVGVTFDRDAAVVRTGALLDAGYQAMADLAPLYYGALGAHADIGR